MTFLINCPVCGTSLATERSTDLRVIGHCPRGHFIASVPRVVEASPASSPGSVSPKVSGVRLPARAQVSEAR